jgi:hypothetical protein
MAASRSYASHQTEVVMNGHNRLFISDPIGYINVRAITPCVRKDVASIFKLNEQKNTFCSGGTNDGKY